MSVDNELREMEIIRRVSEEAIEEMNLKSQKFSAIKDFLYWIEIMKNKLLKYMN